MVQSGLDFQLTVEAGYLAVELPKLNIVTVNKPFCLLLGLAIVGTNQRNSIVKMSVFSNKVGAVFRHDDTVRCAVPYLVVKIAHLAELVTSRFHRTRRT
jgi:hypothetical protein